MRPRLIRPAERAIVAEALLQALLEGDEQLPEWHPRDRAAIMRVLRRLGVKPRDIYGTDDGRPRPLDAPRQTGSQFGAPAAYMRTAAMVLRALPMPSADVYEASGEPPSTLAAPAFMTSQCSAMVSQSVYPRRVVRCIRDAGHPGTHL